MEKLEKQSKKILKFIEDNNQNGDFDRYISDLEFLAHNDAVSKEEKERTLVNCLGGYYSRLEKYELNNTTGNKIKEKEEYEEKILGLFLKKLELSYLLKITKENKKFIIDNLPSYYTEHEIKNLIRYKNTSKLLNFFKHAQLAKK